MPAKLDWVPARMSAAEGGGSGRSAPSSWKAGSVRHTRTYARLLGGRLLTVEINCAALRGLAPRVWRKTVGLALWGSDKGKERTPREAPIGAGYSPCRTVSARFSPPSETLSRTVS